MVCLKHCKVVEGGWSGVEEIVGGNITELCRVIESCLGFGSLPSFSCRRT